MPIELPATSEWYFGGVRYGLEPLILPNPDVADDDLPAGRDHVGYRDACERVLDARMGAGAESEREISWFRWLTGHQVSFVIWRLMAQTMRDVDAGRTSWPDGCRVLADYVRGYCAMLLYTGSCPPRVYQDLIRPSMYLQHRGFSGAWAPDYRPVRDVFRGRLRPGPGELATAVGLYQAIHDGVAAKLVPAGPSLRASARRTGDIRLPDPTVLGLFYDNYFLTVRAQVSRPDVVAQLLRRLVAVTQDVTAHGLHLAGGPRPSQLSSAEVFACEEQLPQINARVASHAARRYRPGAREWDENDVAAER